MRVLLALLLLIAPVAVRAADAPAGLLFAAHFDATSDAEWGKGERRSRPLLPITRGGAGRFGEALPLAGKGALAFPAAGNLNVAEGALEVWVCPKWEGGDGISRTLFDAHWGDRQWLRVNKTAANRLGIATSAGAPDTYRRLDQSVAEWRPGEWHHVAAAWGGGRLRFRIDGKEIPESVTDAPAFQGTPETFSLGPCNALLDEVRIWAAPRDTFDLGAPVAHPALPPVPRRPPGLPPAGDLDRFTGALPPAPDGYLVVAKDYLDDLDPAAAVEPAQVNAELATFSPPGEVEPVACVIYAARPLQGVRVSATDLRGPAARIPAGQVEIRLAVRALMRRVYTRPVTDSEPVSRFLRRNQEFDLPAGHCREVVATLRVPQDTPAGFYRGALRVAPRGAPAGEIPISLEVLPFRLPETPRKRYGCYYQFPELPEGKRQAELELADIRAHGGTILHPHLSLRYRREGEQVRASYEEIEQGLALMKAAGLNGPIPIGTGFQQLIGLLGLPADWVAQGPDGEGQQRLNAAAKPALEGLKQVQARFPEFRLLITHMDEVFGRDRLPLYVALTRAARQVPDLPVYITFHNAPRPEVAEMAKQIEPFVDVRCYNGHTMDDWLRAGNTFDALAADLRRTGDEAWIYYNPRGSFVTPEWLRVINGLYMWWGPLSGHVVWTYHAINGDAFDDTDDPRPEMGFAFPSDEDGITPVPTRHWEAFREGAEDARMLCFLEDLAGKAKAGHPREAAAAEAWLAEVRALFPREELAAITEESPVLVAVSRRFRGADYQRLRRRTADEIGKLLASGVR